MKPFIVTFFVNIQSNYTRMPSKGAFVNVSKELKHEELEQEQLEYDRYS